MSTDPQEQIQLEEAPLQEGASPATAALKTAAIPPEETAGPTGLKLLYEIAQKRLEHQDRAYDQASNRAGSVFAFSTLILTGTKAILESIDSANEKLMFGTVFASSFIALVFNCYKALRVRDLAAGPNPRDFYDLELHKKPEAETQLQAFGTCVQTLEENRGILQQKSAALNAAILALVVLVTSMAFAAGYGAIDGPIWAHLARDSRPTWLGGTHPW